MVKLVGKTKSGPYAATPENSDPCGSRATVILKGNRLGGGGKGPQFKTDAMWEPLS
jgi:hypothetical protein